MRRFHPPSWDLGADALAEKAVLDYPGRFAIMGSFRSMIPLRKKIASWRERTGMLGLRAFLHDPARQWVEDGTLDWLWAEAEEAGVPIAALATDSLAAFERIAERHRIAHHHDHLGGRGILTTLKDAEALFVSPSC